MPATIQEDNGAMRGQIFVLQTGLITTALTLFGVWWLSRNTDDFNIMGWYANYVIPAGALIVGLKLDLSYCAGCNQGELRPSLITGSGEKSTTEKLPPLPASAEFVQGMLGIAQTAASV